MNNSILLARIFFLLISVMMMTTYATAVSPEQSLSTATAITGSLMGIVFAFCLIGLDSLFRRFNLKAFNLVSLGMLFGYVMGTILLLIVHQVLSISGLELGSATAKLLNTATLLFGIYLGVVMTLRTSEELSLSIPFVRFKPKADKKRDIIVDHSVLADARVIDLASSGILDHHLVIPRFIVKELYTEAEGVDENERARARRCLETLKKLEALPSLDLRYNDTDFSDVKESMGKLVKLARMLDASLLTADISQIQISSIEGIRIINIHTLSNALKPLTQAGEHLSIKVQRFGKEPRQGVGYLNDGTMVVVNGGGDYIGDTVKAQVLSVKHTSSGRMVFCNFSEVLEKATPTQANAATAVSQHGAPHHHRPPSYRDRENSRI